MVLGGVLGFALGFSLASRILEFLSAKREADRVAIDNVVNAQEKAWNRGDLDAFLEGYWHSPDLTFSGSGGIARGWDGVLARYKKNYPDHAAMGQLDFSALEFQFQGTAAALFLGHCLFVRVQREFGGGFFFVGYAVPE